MKKLNDRELLDALKQQGFGLTETKDGIRVTRADGEGQPVFVHLSSAGRDNGRRSYSNMTADLKRIGFSEGEPHKRKYHQTDAELATLRAVEAEPGNSPAYYGAALGVTAVAVGQRLNRLQARGVLRAEGNTKSRRYFPVSHVPDDDIPVVQAAREREIEGRMAKNGKPSAGAITVTHIEPTDPAEQLRYHAKNLVELALLYLNSTEGLKQELEAATSKLKRLEDKLGSVLDEL